MEALCRAYVRSSHSRISEQYSDETNRSRCRLFGISSLCAAVYVKRIQSGAAALIGAWLDSWG